MMKKLTALLLCLALLCAPALAESFDVTGTWYLWNIEMDGVSMNPADMSMEIIFELNEDGTGLNTLTGAEPAEATWVFEDGVLTITANESSLDFTITDEGYLLNALEESGLNMYFAREKPAPSFIPAEPIAADDISQFNGTWTAETCNFYGVTMPFADMESMGMTDPVVVIEDGVVTKFGEEPETGVLEDGILRVYSTTENDTDNIFGSTFTLLEDGTLKIVYLGIVFYTGGPAAN